ncbi:MAG: hypothetical protein ACKVH2_04615 [Flavobacteriales bacterium]
MTNNTKDNIYWNIEANVKVGAYKNLCLLIIKMKEYVKNNEPETLGYSFYFNSDKNKLYIYECYSSNASALKHMHGFNQFSKDFFSVIDIYKVNIFGPVNRNIKEIFDNSPTTYWLEK